MSYSTKGGTVFTVFVWKYTEDFTYKRDELGIQLFLKYFFNCQKAYAIWNKSRKLTHSFTQLQDKLSVPTRKIEWKVNRFIRKYVMLAPNRVGRAGLSVGVRRLPSLCLERCVEVYSSMWACMEVRVCFPMLFVYLFVFNFFDRARGFLRTRPHSPTSCFQVLLLGPTFLSRAPVSLSLFLKQSLILTWILSFWPDWWSGN